MTEQELMNLLTWDRVEKLWNSAFITSLVGALAGAYAGARAAQKIAERSKARDVRSLNYGPPMQPFVVAHIIFSSALSLKNQHIKPMFDAFQKAKEELEEFQKQRASGVLGDDAQFYFQADVSTFPTVVAPLEMLRD